MIAGNDPKTGLYIYHYFSSARGGGCGDLRERSRALVKRDVAYGYITHESAQRVYGFEY